MTQCIAVISADKEIAELCGEFSDLQLVGFFDPASAAAISGISHLGADSNWESVRAACPGLKVVVALDPPMVKQRAVEFFGLQNLATLISEHAFVSASASIGTGCILQRGVSVMADARIGLACKINLNASVHHDCVVGDFCTIAPGAMLLGYVLVDAGAGRLT